MHPLILFFIIVSINFSYIEVKLSGLCLGTFGFFVKCSTVESQWKKWDMFYVIFCGYCGVFLSCSERQHYSFVQSCGVRIRNDENNVSASLIRHHSVTVLHCMSLLNFTMKIFKPVPWGVQDETLSMVISFNVFIVRNKLNTITHVDRNQMLYYSFKPFLYIEVSRHRAICMPSKGTLMSVSSFKGSRNKTYKLRTEDTFISLSTSLVIALQNPNRIPVLQASDASICH